MSKRKAEELSVKLKEVDEDLAKCFAAIRNDTYPELLRIKESLLRAKERRQALADKHRKLQIKNINELYEYELRGIDVQYQDAYEAARERLKFEVNDAARKATSIVANELGEKDRKDKENTSHRSLHTTQMAKLEGVPDTESVPEVLVKTQYLPRSLADIAHDRKFPKTEVLKERRKDGGLKYSVPDSSARADFLEIVQDLQRRNAVFARTAARPSPAVRVVSDENSGIFSLVIGIDIFSSGDLVTVFSVLSQESFSGVIMAVSLEEIAIRCGSGLRIAIHIPQLLNGQLVLHRDSESYQAYDAIKAAARLPRVEQINSTSHGSDTKLLNIVG